MKNKIGRLNAFLYLRKPFLIFSNILLYHILYFLSNQSKEMKTFQLCESDNKIKVIFY